MKIGAWEDFQRHASRLGANSSLISIAIDLTGKYMYQYDVFFWLAKSLNLMHKLHLPANQDVRIVGNQNEIEPSRK